MTLKPIRRRLLVHLGGYDPVSPAAAHARFAREARRFERTWSVRADVSPAAEGPDLTTWTMQTAGPDWLVETAVWLLRWEDVMAAQSRQSAWRRLPLGLFAFADFVSGGAFWGYLRRAWRYAIFFLYPFLLLVLLAAAASLLGLAVARGTGLILAGLAAGSLAFVALVAFAGTRMSLSHLLDDWIFARRYLRDDDPVLGPRLDRVAAELVAAARSDAADEIVVLGHSLGAVLAVDLLARALTREPGLGRLGRPVVLVTVGSSIPKIGLHRAARRFRAALQRVADAPGLFWVEYQALTDAMNFYKTNPVRLLLGRETGGPVVRIVRISRMLAPDYYRRIKRNFFRLHNQFVSSNDARAPYDYFMVVAGPVPVERQARAAEGAETGIAPDGRLAGAVVPETAMREVCP